MNNKSLLLAASLAAAAFTSSAFASSNAQDASASVSQPRPVASSIVKPTGLPREFTGAIVDVEFALDQTGQPRDIKVLRVDNAVLKRQLVAAFQQWRFEAGMNAPANSKRFILPILLAPEV